MTLRPYQSAAVDAIFRAWQDARATLLVLPTGTGKTIVFADVARRIAADGGQEWLVRCTVCDLDTVPRTKEETAAQWNKRMPNKTRGDTL